MMAQVRPWLAMLVMLFIVNVSPAHATWSIVVLDTFSQEVGVASATCVSNQQLPGIDLRSLSPALVVGRGAGAAQSLIDGDGMRRLIIATSIASDIDADGIVGLLLGLPNTSLHQHGVVGAGASAATQTGSNNGAHASGVAGADGTLQYAIQGNVLTGPEVVTAAEQALLTSPGDLTDKLQSAMEAARDFGGDGRCSCSPANPTACGAPPASFEKSAHVGYLIMSRFGDADDPACGADGCADGDYYLSINVADQPPNAADPVDQMRTQLDAIRSDLLGRPDAIQTQLEFIRVPAGYLMRLVLLDHTGEPVAASIDGVSVEHAPQSANNTSIGPVTDHGDGTYTVLLRLLGGTGSDVFLIMLEDQERMLVLPPNHATLEAEILFINGFEAAL